MKINAKLCLQLFYNVRVASVQEKPSPDHISTEVLRSRWEHPTVKNDVVHNHAFSTFVHYVRDKEHL